MCLIRLLVDIKTDRYLLKAGREVLLNARHAALLINACAAELVAVI